MTIDVYFIETGIENEDSSVSTYIQQLWQALYWTLYIMSLLFIPFYKSYEEADGFYFKEKAYKSVKENLISYGIIILLIFLLCLYFIISSSISLTDVLAIMSSVSCTIGIIIVVILNGYGLIIIPKNYILLLNKDYEKKYLLWKASMNEDKVLDNSYKLIELRKKVWYIIKEEKNKEVISDNIEKIKEIWERIHIRETDIIFKSISNYSIEKDDEMRKYISQIEYASLIRLNKESKRLITKRLRLIYHQENNIKNYNNYIISREEEEEMIEFIVKNTYKYKVFYIYNKYFKFICNIIGIIITCFLSLVIFIAEITLFYKEINLNLIGIFIKLSENYILFLFFIIFPLIYYTYSTFYVLIKVRLKHYAICNSNTDNISMLYFSSILCYLVFPLFLNFLQVLKLKNKTSLELIIGYKSNLMFVTDILLKYSPIMLIFICLLTVFGVFSKVISYFGVDIYESHRFEEESFERCVSKGKDIIIKYMRMKKNRNEEGRGRGMIKINEKEVKDDIIDRLI